MGSQDSYGAHVGGEEGSLKFLAKVKAETSKPVYSESDLQTWLVSKLADVMDLKPKGIIDIRESFATYGVDSITGAAIAGDLENLLGCKLPATLLYDYPTIEGLARHLAAGGAIKK
jgi:acyl carrier protein